MSNNECKVVTVLSSIVVSHMATTTLVLHTQELGAISFEVNQRAIPALRKALAAAEIFFKKDAPPLAVP